MNRRIAEREQPTTTGYGWTANVSLRERANNLNYL